MNPDPKDIIRMWESREKFQRENPIFGIRLSPKQREFFDTTINSRDDLLPRQFFGVGSNKQGKTFCNVLRGFALATGEHPFLPEDHPLRIIPNWELPTVGLVVGEQLTQSVDKKLVPEYQKWIPKICQPKYKKNQQGVIVKITLPYDLHGNKLGSIIHMRSYDSKASTLEGIDQHWIGWDEPPPYSHYVAAERGLVPTDGVSFMTFTSLKEPWIKDLADESIDYGGIKDDVRIMEFGEIWNNCVERGGILTRAAIESYISKVPKEDYPARVEGKWLHSGSIIYSSFQEEEPYVVPNFEIPSHWTRIEAIDPHDGKPTKWLFCAISPQEIVIDDEVLNRIFVVDYENYPVEYTIKDMVRSVQKKRIDLGYGQNSLYAIILDAKHGGKKTKTLDGKEPEKWKEKFEAAGAGYIIYSHSASGDVALGHKIVKSYLMPQLYKPAEKEYPGIVFMQRCGGPDSPIEAMQKYRYKIGTDIPDEAFKDWMDCVRYVCLERPVYINRWGEMGQRGYNYVPRDTYAGR